MLLRGNSQCAAVAFECGEVLGELIFQLLAINRRNTRNDLNAVAEAAFEPFEAIVHLVHKIEPIWPGRIESAHEASHFLDFKQFPRVGIVALDRDAETSAGGNSLAAPAADPMQEGENIIRLT